MPSEPPPPTPSAPVLSERRGVLRIDEQPERSRFQGVWFEHDGTRWIVDYRARALWTAFVDREVIVTGGCYEPDGHAIRAPHLRIDTLRPVSAERGRGPYLSIGPEQWLRGELVVVSAPAGSKAAGSARLTFRADDGAAYTVVADAEDGRTGRVTVRARVLEPDMSYVARSDGPDLWIVDVHDADHDTSAASVPRSVPCP